MCVFPFVLLDCFDCCWGFVFFKDAVGSILFIFVSKVSSYSVYAATSVWFSLVVTDM